LDALSHRYSLPELLILTQYDRLMPPKVSNKKAIIEQLCNSKVYTVRKITLKWTVKVRGRGEVVGRVDSGRVKITVIGKSLEVYLRRSDSDISRPPLELLEELAAFCRLTEASHVALLHAVMTEIYSSDMEAIFNRRGLHQDAPEFNALVGSSKLNPDFWSGSASRYNGDADYWEDEEATFDAVSRFMRRFTALNQWDDAKARPWSKTRTDSVLSHLCRLENVDPYSLLPQTSLSRWGGRLRNDGAFLDDPTSISFIHPSSVSGKKSRLRPYRLFPALVKINRARETVIEMLPDSTIDVARDVILAGEVYVRPMFIVWTRWWSSNNQDRSLSCLKANYVSCTTPKYTGRAHFGGRLD
jgi:hypothetical protein